MLHASWRIVSALAVDQHPPCKQLLHTGQVAQHAGEGAKGVTTEAAEAIEHGGKCR
jgi:hypothetical protein